MPLPYPVIVIPGITATYLRDDYPLPPDEIWSVIKKEFERIAMHPDNPRYEAVEPARVQQGQIFEIAYKELIEELKHNLTPREEEPVPVYPFGYDWRMPVEMVQDALAAFIDEVIDRTKLMRHYFAAGYANNPRVNLVGHSMGGLVIAGYLSKYGRNNKVAKVATIGTPFQGSYEAVIKITTGTANLGVTPPSSRERESARLIPALYYLLPSFSGAVTVPEGAPFTDSLFDAGIWQTSVTQSIAEFIRKRGVNTQNPEGQAQNLFKRFLDQAASHRTTVDRLELAGCGLTDEDWLCVIGVGCDTRVKLGVTTTNNLPNFSFASKDRLNNWGKKDGSDPRQTGDGTVPLYGALPKFLSEERIICVTPDDYGYWEIQDRVLTKVAGFHGIFPNMDMLHRLIVRFFTGKADPYNNTWGRKLPGVATWNPPLKLREK